MKYKVGDKVRIKSKEWWDAQPKNESGDVNCGADTFIDFMTPMCGKIVEISDVLGDTYRIKGYGYNWTDEMLEDVELDNDEKSTISEVLIKDIAEVIKQHNLGVCVSENEGKLIIEPLQKENDLPIDTPVIYSNNTVYWSVGYYKGFSKVSRRVDCKSECDIYSYVIPFDKFNPNDIQESLKYNIVDKIK